MFASPENDWEDLFWRYIPDWFTPSEDVLENYFEGESTLYTLVHIRGGLVPVMVWTVFIAAIWFVLLCINSLIRAQWTEKEKLAYPIIQLPLKMISEERPSFFRNKAMWLGFGVAGLFEILAGLNYLFPKVPAVQLNYYYARFGPIRTPTGGLCGVNSGGARRLTRRAGRACGSEGADGDPCLCTKRKTDGDCRVKGNMRKKMNGEEIRMLYLGAGG